MIMEKREAVMKYGSEKCKEHFLKYKKFKNKSLGESLTKTLKQHYDHVEVIKMGRKHVYELKGEKEVVGNREDNRISNGAWSGVYTKNLDIIVVSVLEQEFIKETAQTLNRWLLDFGLINRKTYELLTSRYNDSVLNEHVEKLSASGILKAGEERLLSDYVTYTMYLQQQLAGTLNRMKKLNIIEFYPVPKGHIEKTGEVVNLHESTVKEILYLDRRLKQKYDVNSWYCNQFKNASKVKEYKKELKKELAFIRDENGMILGMDYWFNAHAIILKATEMKIITYLEKYNCEAIDHFKQDQIQFLTENKLRYYIGRTEYMAKVAERKQDSFLRGRIKNDVSLLQEYGGKTSYIPPIQEKLTYDIDYYALYFDRLYMQRILELQEYYGHEFN